MSSKFDDFVNRILETSKLEITGGKLTNAFVAEFSRREDLLKTFKIEFKPIWESWKKNQGKHLISPFIEAHGNIIFRKWLTEIYPFEYYSLRLACKRGPSSVDAVMLVNYFFSPEELVIIQKNIEKYAISVPLEETCRLLLTNAIKSIPTMLSEIMEIDYRIFIEKLTNDDRTKQGFQVMVRAVGRIG